MAEITERDANCKNCLHVHVCAFRNLSEDEKICSQFINKADVVEVRHGDWETSDTILGRCCVCSVCGSCPTMEYRYCPYCGAKMDGKGESAAG